MGNTRKKRENESRVYRVKTSKGIGSLYGWTQFKSIYK